MHLISPSSYIPLGDAFYQAIAPQPVLAPQLLLFNRPLAKAIGASDLLASDDTKLAKIFSGNQLIADSQPLALAYSGHQFGQFNPQLGDGRAHIIGETSNENGQLFDVQLKGSGRTRFSRQGDGRCAIGPAIREYLMSEAMAALNVSSTRCLAVVSSGETVFRNNAQQGAVVTRVASSHIRVGTFQYFAAREDISSLRKLLTFSIERHYPAIAASTESNETEQTLQFLQHVIDKQIALVVDWLRVGFIHGVMNTDNTAISGETIDYGPCAMMNHYDPNTVFSSIDHHGRYAFGNQANIAVWNMARLIEALLPLIDDDSEQAIAKATPLLEGMQVSFAQAYYSMLANKLGFSTGNDQTKTLVENLLNLMYQHKLDYTQTFYALTQHAFGEATTLPDELSDWLTSWQALLCEQNSENAAQLMQQKNPVVIPRNHHVEAIIKAFEEETPQRFSQLATFIDVITKPYEKQSNTEAYQHAPTDGDANYQTFCGT